MRFHILSDDLDDADKAILQGIAAKRENTEVCFYSPEQALSEETLALIKRKSSQRFTKNAYHRILAAELLPDTVHCALYLDGDVLCLGHLEDLFAIDLRGYPCGQCCEERYLNVQRYNLLCYPWDDGYFNTGVMLIDLDLWRKENIARAMFDYLAANASKPLYYDQDVINAVLHGQILPIDFPYNVTSGRLNVYYWINEEKNGYYARSTQFLTREDWPALLAACENPRLVHFTTKFKPWHKECTNPFAPVWRYFYAASPWKDEPLQWKNPPEVKPEVKPSKRKVLDTAKKKIKRLGRKALEAVHLVEKRKPKPAPKPNARGLPFPYPEEAYKAAQRVLEGLIEEDERRKSLE